MFVYGMCEVMNQLEWDLLGVIEFTFYKGRGGGRGSAEGKSSRWADFDLS